MATLGDALKQGKCWDALPVSDLNKIVGASSLENIAVVTPLKSWADLTELEREAMLAVDWTRATMSAPERCTVCLNPGKINHLGYCSDCVDSYPTTQQEERDVLQSAHELNSESFVEQAQRAANDANIAYGFKTSLRAVR